MQMGVERMAGNQWMKTDVAFRCPPKAEGFQCSRDHEVVIELPCSLDLIAIARPRSKPLYIAGDAAWKVNVGGNTPCDSSPNTFLCHKTANRLERPP